jgi:Mg-chelatase subunit ChlD
VRIGMMKTITANHHPWTLRVPPRDGIGRCGAEPGLLLMGPCASPIASGNLMSARDLAAFLCAGNGIDSLFLSLSFLIRGHCPRMRRARYLRGNIKCRRFSMIINRQPGIVAIMIVFSLVSLISARENNGAGSRRSSPTQKGNRPSADSFSEDILGEAAPVAGGGNLQASREIMDIGEAGRYPAPGNSQSSGSFSSRAATLADGEIARTYYSPVTRALIEGISVFRYVYGLAEYVFLGAPSMALSMASGGPMGVVQDVAWDTVDQIIKETFHDPETASRKIAKFAYDLGLGAYRSNYGLYQAYKTAKSFSEMDGRTFVRNWCLQDYMPAAKILYNDTTDYEKKDTVASSDKARQQVQESSAIKMAKDAFGDSAEHPVDWLIHTVKLEFTVFDSAIKASAGLGSYPPYQKFLARSRAITTRLAESMDPATADSTFSQVANMPLNTLSELNLTVKSSSSSNAVDLIFCIDTTGSMRNAIDSAKTSATKIIDQVFAASPSVRVALVAYRDYGSAYVTKGYPFTQNKEEIRRDIMSLEADEGGDPPEAVYEALLHAIQTKDLGPWRSGVKKIIILMGDAPPHTKQHTQAEVVKAAAEVDPAHIFPIPVGGADAETLALFSQLAEKTGGVMSPITASDALPSMISRMLEIGVRTADAITYQGKVSSLLGDSIEVVLAGETPVLPGMSVLIFSNKTPGVLIAEGPVVSGSARRYLVNLRAAFGTEIIQLGCQVKIVGSRER